METQEIRDECAAIFEIIKKAKERLKEIQSICPHTNWGIGLYSFHEGQYLNKRICNDCGCLFLEPTKPQ